MTDDNVIPMGKLQLIVNKTKDMLGIRREPVLTLDKFTFAQAFSQTEIFKAFLRQNAGYDQYEMTYIHDENGHVADISIILTKREWTTK